MLNATIPQNRFGLSGPAEISVIVGPISRSAKKATLISLVALPVQALAFWGISRFGIPGLEALSFLASLGFAISILPLAAALSLGRRWIFRQAEPNGQDLGVSPEVRIKRIVIPEVPIVPAAPKKDISEAVQFEVRTYMNAILGIAQVMEETRLTPEQKQLMEALEKSAEGLYNLFGRMVDLSTIQSGKVVPRSERFTLRTLCEECVNVFQSTAVAKGVNIQISFLNGLPTEVGGDPEKIRKILICLLGNAVKYTERGLITFEVTPIMGHTGKVSFTVKDSGSGMSRETMATLFSNFEMMDSEVARKPGSTGLGLTICHGLAKLLGGTITVNSILGHGSQFRVELPIRETVSSQAPPPDAKKDFAGARVLFVDDDAVNTLVVVKFLQKYSVEVEVAKNGQEAVEKWKRGKFDLVFMDLQMPVMDGYVAASTIRSMEKVNGLASRIPIVALTANVQADDRLKCLEVGMDDYLSKPVKSESLRAAMESWIKPAIAQEAKSMPVVAP